MYIGIPYNVYNIGSEYNLLQPFFFLLNIFIRLKGFKWKNFKLSHQLKKKTFFQFALHYTFFRGVVIIIQVAST